MKWISVLIALLFLQEFHAQNYVPNPSFETTNGSYCGIMMVGDYSSTAVNWNSPTQGTPDLYFTTINSSCFNFQPNSTYNGPIGLKGPQLPRTGNVMSGIFLYTLPGFEQREYIQVPLSSPLIIGGKYVVECYVSLSDSTEFATNRLGMYLSTQAVTLGSDGVMNYTPQIVSNSIVSSTQDWVRIADTLIATTAYTHLTIGNFSTDAQTPTTPNPTSSFKPGMYGSYYFIDDVRVERVLMTSGLDDLEISGAERKVIKIIDLLGRETEFKANTTLILIYNDGTTECTMSMDYK